jgi:membrane protein implicated in regulation of membrane protease activity
MLTGALVIVALIAVAAFALSFVVARRALRLFVRLAIVAVVAVLLLVGYVWWRWQSATPREPPPARNERRQSAPARR